MKASEERRYMDYVRSQVSCVSGRPADDPHHIKGRGYGGSSKPSALLTIPLTRDEHQDFHSSGWISWEEKHNVDQRDLALRMIDQAAIAGVIKA